MPQPAKIDRDRVLAEALCLVRTSGCDALSMRELAGRLKVKAPSLYRYFPDRLTLEKAISEAGNTILMERVTKAVDGKTERAAFQEAGKAYLAFARAEPHLYHLMMERRLTFPAVSATGKQLWNLFLAIVGQVSGNPDDTARAVAYWSFLHGFTSLEGAGRFGSSGPQGGFETGIQALAEGFRPQ